MRLLEESIKGQNQNLMILDILVKEAESSLLLGEESYARGDFLSARNCYGSMRAKLIDAAMIARDIQDPECLGMVLGKMDVAERGIAASDCWLPQAQGKFDVPLPYRVKAIISPYFRREDGGSAPRPGGH